MIDYDHIEIRRLQDRASPSYLNYRDRFRTWRILQNPRIQAGNNITFKEGVEISICEGGRLIVGEHCFFHARCWLLLTRPGPEVKLGRWVFLGRNMVIAAKNRIEIGDFTIFAPYCYVVDHEHGFAASAVILNQASVLKEVHIGRDCYFGTGTVVLGGVSVGDGAIIGAGSVVTCNVPAGEIWGGNPVRFIRKRE